VETPIECEETSSSVGKRGGVPRRAGLSERGDAGRGGLDGSVYYMKHPVVRCIAATTIIRHLTYTSPTIATYI